MSERDRAEVLACVGLGSNLGDRAANIREGVRRLGLVEATHVERVSSLIETAAVRVGEADPGGPYLNGAATVRTRLSAKALLHAMHAIEADLGRNRSAGGTGRGAARTLDLDLLLYGEAVIDDGGVATPHPRLRGREFVLAPLCEIAPEARVPGTSGERTTTVRALLAALRGGALVLAAVIMMTGMAGAQAREGVRAGLQAGVQAGAPGGGTRGGQVSGLSPVIALQEAKKAYGEGPTAEKVAVRIRAARRADAPDRKPESKEEEFVIRIEPGSSKDAPRPRTVALELGVLRVWAGEGRIIAIATTNAETYFESQYDPATPLTAELLGEKLNPLPLLGLVLLLQDPEAAARAFRAAAYLPPVSWSRLTLETKGDKAGLYILAGSSEAGPADMTIDAATGRLRRFSSALAAPRAGESEGPGIEVTVSPAAKSDPAGWKISVEGRQRVGSLGALRKGEAGAGPPAEGAEK